MKRRELVKITDLLCLSDNPVALQCALLLFRTLYPARVLHVLRALPFHESEPFLETMQEALSVLHATAVERLYCQWITNGRLLNFPSWRLSNACLVPAWSSLSHFSIDSFCTCAPCLPPSCKHGLTQRGPNWLHVFSHSCANLWSMSLERVMPWPLEAKPKHLARRFASPHHTICDLRAATKLISATLSRLALAPSRRRFCQAPALVLCVLAGAAGAERPDTSHSVLAVGHHYSSRLWHHLATLQICSFQPW